MGEFFVVLFFVLCVVTVVGHGIWVLMAAILRRMGGVREPGEYITQETRERLAEVQASCYCCLFWSVGLRLPSGPILSSSSPTISAGTTSAFTATAVCEHRTWINSPARACGSMPPS